MATAQRMRPALVLLLLLAACATATRGISAKATTLYTSFGRADPRHDEEVVTTWEEDRDLLLRNARNPGEPVKLKGGRTSTVGELARKRVDAVRGVEVLVDTVPEGIEIDRGSAKVKEGSGFVLLGRFSMRYAEPRALTKAVDDVKVLVNAADGNLAVISWERESQRTTAGVVGLVFSISGASPIDRNKLRSGKVTEL